MFQFHFFDVICYRWKYADSQPPTFEYSGITIAATKPVNVEIELRN